jgi:hypothetical protein
MTDDTFFARVIGALERSGTPYMVTGSFASSAHGRIRATQDLDIVIAPDAEQLRALIDQFPGDRYYADESDALDAFEHRSLFNIIDFATPWKADLIMRKSREFSRVEFDRRVPYVIGGTGVYVTTPEDIVIAKLEWAKLGESERQLEDAAGVIATQGPNLDVTYVERWVRELGLEQQWEKAKEHAR